MSIKIDVMAWHPSDKLTARTQSLDGSCVLHLYVGDRREQDVTIFLPREHFQTVEHIAELLNKCSVKKGEKS